MNRREPENGLEEYREVAERLGALPRVEAPSNFEFGVKARIAAGGSKQRSTLFPFLKIAAPLTFVLLIGLVVLYFGTNRGSDNTVAETIPQNYAPASNAVAQVENRVEQPQPLAITEPEQAPAGTQSADPKPRTPKIRIPRVPSNSASPGDGGGSKDFGLTDANLIQAPGTKVVKNPETSVRELLEVLGMKVDLVGGKWSVLATSANSVAARSGVLANDVIEAINDQLIGGATKFKGSDGRTITVARGGKSIKLSLKP